MQQLKYLGQITRQVIGVLIEIKSFALAAML
jgi:hypothetical protein